MYKGLGICHYHFTPSIFVIGVLSVKNKLANHSAHFGICIQQAIAYRMCSQVLNSMADELRQRIIVAMFFGCISYFACKRQVFKQMTFLHLQFLLHLYHYIACVGKLYKALVHKLFFKQKGNKQSQKSQIVSSLLGLCSKLKMLVANTFCNIQCKKKSFLSSLAKREVIVTLLVLRPYKIPSVVSIQLVYLQS